MMAGAPATGGCVEIIHEFSRCWGYLEHLGKVAKDASYLMEGTMGGYDMDSLKGTEGGFIMEGIGERLGLQACQNSIERSQVNFIADLVEKVMKDYRKVSKPKVKAKCNFYNRGFCHQGTLCDFEHPTEMCEKYLREGECSQRYCNGRHVYQCRYFQSHQGCFRGSSCAFLHHHDVVTNLEEENDKIDDEEDVEDHTTNEQKEETVEGTIENADKTEDFNEEVNKYREVFGDESDGFLVLEKAITNGIDLDDDLLDKILEGMEKSDCTDAIELDDEHLDKILEGMEKSDESKDEKKTKKKKVKKASGKAFKKTLAN